MKLKYTYSFQKYDNRYLAIVDITENDKDKRLLWVNECGKMIMELLQNEITYEELIDKILVLYDGEKEIIKSAVDSFIEKLLKEDIILNNQ